jgi:hypothetical protein
MHILTNYLFLKSTYCKYILEKILSTFEVGPILALIAPSPHSFTDIWLNMQIWLILKTYRLKS